MEDKIAELLLQYGIAHPEISLLRHNENRTYKVTDRSDSNTYLLRVHEPITVNMAGIQHTRQGVESELKLLEAIARGTDLAIQAPVVSRSRQLVTEIEIDGQSIYCSLLRWIDGRNMTKEDLSTPDAAYRLGAQVANLQAFFATYDKVIPSDRPDYGIRRIERMLTQIRRGVELELFSDKNFDVVEQTLNLIVDRLKAQCPETVKQGIIHADLNMGNIIVTPLGRYVFIDYCLFGSGYRLFDVAMTALNAPKETREHVVKGYYGKEPPKEEIYPVIEGFMLTAVLGYYAFVMENEAVHSWIRERMPQFCDNRCGPFLKDKSIFLSF
ncbi:aminoglycoside phosphotransferase family protein [Paenibacillus sp. GD4]|uniref:phosphotransferase enzyme family protein n=1 Tax=Paenibacillus sp. GD4 TaxID=3068890 RepID=UPI00279660AD|nr:aminoglycoside phosphotransferase family protein [Paenibacillus sp. GD4]MDQ1914313.1 aminoglycoside phosphotransferase family protein [Paenibacillus sp. GD4]